MSDLKKRSISLLSAAVYEKTAAAREERVVDGSEMPGVAPGSGGWEGIQHDEFLNTNHTGGDYGEILFDEGTEYEKRARTFTKEGLDDALRKRYKVMAPPSDSDEVSSLYSGGEVDCMLQNLLDSSKSVPIIENSVLRFHRSSDPFRQTLNMLPQFGTTSIHLSDNTILVMCGRHTRETTQGTNTVLEYHMLSRQWSICNLQQKSIPPRFDHTTSVVQTQPDGLRRSTKFVLFGGRNGNSVMRDMYEFVVEDTRKVEPDKNSGLSISLRGITVTNIIKNSDSLLPALCDHTMVSVSTESVLIIFGGQTSEGDCANDLYMFDMSSKTTIKPTLVGEVPTKRCGHSAVLLEETSTLLIFGGKTLIPHFAASEHLLNDLYEINLTTNISTQVITTTQGGISPLPRWKHTCHENNGTLVIISGETETGDYNHGTLTDENRHLFEVYTLELQNGAFWSKKKFPLSANQPAFVGHSSVLVDGSIYIVGGLPGHQKSVNRSGMASVPLELSLKDICALHILENRLYTLPPRKVQQLRRVPPGRKRTRVP